MDSAKLMLTDVVSSPLERIKKISDASEEEKKQYAKDFESVFISKLFDTVKDSIGNWGFEKDGAYKQTQGIFWLYLARDMANNGGFGLWKDIYKFLTTSENKSTATKSLDEVS